MLTPTFRFLALPLAAVCALIALSLQPAASRSPGEANVAVREQVVCSQSSASDVCVIGEAAGS